MSGDVQPRKRKKEAVAAARRKKDSEGDILSRKLTAKEEDKEPTVSGVKSLGQDDVQMHVQNNHGTGGHWCAKIVFFFLLAVLLGLVGLIILENRGQSDLDTPLSESRYSEILEGWVQEDREVFDEHDAAEALNELDNLDHDNEPFEEEPDVSGEEDHDDHDEEGEEAEHSEEEEEVNEEPSATAEEEDGDDVDPQSDEDKEGDDDEELNDAAEDPKPDLGIREKRETVTDPEVNASDEEEEEEGDNVSVEQRQEIPHQHVPFEEESREPQQVSVDDLQLQVDEMKRIYNRLAMNLNHKPIEELESIENEEENRRRRSIPEVDDDSDDESQKQNAQDEDDDEDNASLEPVIDNDNGEEEHLQRLAEQNKGPVADDAATEQEPESSTASQLPPLPRGQQANAEEAELSADEFRRANQFINNNPALALREFEALLLNDPSSFDAEYGRAQALDALAEEDPAVPNVLRSIKAHEKLLLERASEMEEDLFRSVAKTCLDRLQSIGLFKRASAVHEALTARFPTDPEIRVQRAINFLLSDDLPSAKKILHNTLMNWRYHGRALLYYAYTLAQYDKDYEGAVAYFQEGFEMVEEKPLDGRLFLVYGEALQRLERDEDAIQVFKMGSELNLFPSEYQRSLYNVRDLEAKPFWSVQETGMGDQLEAIQSQWQKIRDEVKRLLDDTDHFADESEHLLHVGDWKQLVLYSRGEKSETNCEKTPFTCKLLDSFPEARSCTRGQIKFSVLQPGTHVWPHCGPTNCRLRAHLALEAEQGRTAIRVAREKRFWEEGEWLVFDDSFEHEVWHNGTERRLVLILDIWHPDLSEYQRKHLPAI